MKFSCNHRNSHHRFPGRRNSSSVVGPAIVGPSHLCNWVRGAASCARLCLPELRDRDKTHQLVTITPPGPGVCQNCQVTAELTRFQLEITERTGST